MQTPGGAMYHHAPRPGRAGVLGRFRIWPHDGANGSPRPMNARVVSVRTAPAKMSTALATMRFIDVGQDVPAHDVAAAGADDPRPVDERRAP